MIKPIITNATGMLLLIPQAPMLLCAKHSMELVVGDRPSRGKIQTEPYPILARPLHGGGRRSAPSLPHEVFAPRLRVPTTADLARTFAAIMPRARAIHSE